VQRIIDLAINALPSRHGSPPRSLRSISSPLGDALAAQKEG